METFARNLRERATQLGISNAEAARRAGLDERRYGHYVSGRREPDLATLVRIAVALGTHPNALLGLDADGSPQGEHAHLLGRLRSAGEVLPETELRSLTVQAEALAATYGRPSPSGR